MAITISGQNNNDKILASDGVLDQISGFNVVGVMTATTFNVTTKHTANHIDVGSTVQLGNAGIITATTLIGNVTGNVNSTSHLLLQISGSEKFRVGNGGQFGIAGANYGTAGQVFTSGGSGSAPTWSTIASDKITEGNTEAEVVDTGSDGHFKVTTEGSERFRVDSSGRVLIGTTVEGYDTGDNLTIASNGHTGITIRSGTSAGGNIFFSDGTSGADEYRGNVSYDHTNNFMRFYVNAAVRLRITSDGRMLLGTTTPGNSTADDLTIATSSNTGITLRSATYGEGNIFFGDGTSGADQYRGMVRYYHNGDALAFHSGGGERLRITQYGNIGINTTSPENNSNDVSLHIHGSANDDCRISFSTPTKSNPGSRIGYYGLNRFGIDTYDGIEMRDVTRSYATIFKIDQNGYMQTYQPYGYVRFNTVNDTGGENRQTDVYTHTVENGMSHSSCLLYTSPSPRDS